MMNKTDQNLTDASAEKSQASINPEYIARLKEMKIERIKYKKDLLLHITIFLLVHGYALAGVFISTYLHDYQIAIVHGVISITALMIALAEKHILKTIFM